MASKFHLVLVHGIPSEQSDNDELRPATFFSKRYPDSVITEFDLFDQGTEVSGADFLRERAQVLLDQLKGQALSPLIFMGHNLGGSLIKKALVLATEESEYQEIATSTVGIIFFGTPHKAKDTLAWEHQIFRLLSISKSTSIRPANLLRFLPQALEDLYTDYATISHAYGVVCVSEKAEPDSDSAPILPQLYSINETETTSYCPFIIKIFGNSDQVDKERRLCVEELKHFSEMDHKVCVFHRIAGHHGNRLTPTDETFSRKQFLQALCQVDPETHQMKLRRAAPGTVDWLSDHPAFVGWMKAPKDGILRVCGPPGSGTTVVTSHLLKMLLEREGFSGPIVTSFTFNRQHIHARTPQSLILSLCRQLLSARPSLFRHVSRVCATLSEFTLFTQDTLLILLCTLLKRSFGTPVVCIIHATQECDMPLQPVIDQLERFTALSNGSLKIIVTEEDSHDTHHDSHSRVCLGQGDSKVAIVRQFAQTHVTRLVRNKPQWGRLEKDIMEALCMPSTSYLLGLRIMNLLLKPDSQKTLAAMKQRIKDLPTSLEESYAQALEQIPENQRTWIQSALRWIVHAARPLRRSELAVAVAFEVFTDKTSTSPLEDLVSFDIVNDLNLAVGPLFKLEDDHVYLVHRSFRNFLTQGLEEKNSDAFNHTHTLTRCLQYLECFGKPYLSRKNTDLQAAELSLVEYTTLYWPVHYKLSNSEPRALSALSKFLCAENVETWSELYTNFRSTEFPRRPLRKPFLIGCRFGLLEIVEASISEVKSSYSSSEILQQGLNLGARYGHSLIVKKLIGEKVTSELALKLAAQSGIVEIVSDLLSVHPDLNTTDDEGWTALHHSAARGYEAITSLLLNGSADPDVMTSDKSTPLHLAATTGQLKIVKILVEAKSDFTLLDGSGYDALKLATQSGYSDVVEYLLSRNADVKAVSPDGVTALHLAVEFGHIFTAQILMEHGSEIDIPNNSGLTPIHLAAKNGYLEILKELLEVQKRRSPSETTETDQGDDLSLVSRFQIDDEERESPLQLAARVGHIEIVKELLQHSVVDDDVKRDIAVALYQSASRGYGATVSELLRHDVKCIAEDEDGNTALHLAAHRCHVEVLTQLLERPEFDINAPNGAGWTVLHKAAELGNVEIVRKIIAVQPELDCMNEDRATPMHIAAQNGHLLTLRVLMNESDTSQMPDNEGRTPFSLAAESGQIDIVKELLSTYDPEQDLSGPFHRAAHQGHRDVVELFLDEGWDINCRNALKQTPLHLACWSPNASPLVELLLTHNPEVDAEDDDGETPLSYAARSSTAEVAKALLKAGADINAPDTNGTTPLYRASYAGNIDVVRELLAWQPTPDLNIQSNRGWTALHAAYDNSAITQLLLSVGADATLKNDDSESPIILVIKSGYEEVFKCHLQAEIESHGLSSERISDAIRCAVEVGSDEMLQILIEKGADVHAENEKGSTALHVAASQGRIELLKLLIDKGADIHKISEYWGSALTAAARGFAFDCVKFLVEKGVDVNAKGGEYYTALQAAAFDGDSAMVELLLTHKADPNMIGGKFGTALLAATSESHTEIVRLLLESGADPNGKGSAKDAPLQEAASHGMDDILELLLTRGAKTNDTGGTYGSALHAAVEKGYRDCVEILLDHGADPNMSITGYPTPVQVAARKDLLPIFKLLTDRGADLDVIDEEGRTITMVALTWNSHSIVEYVMRRDDLVIVLDRRDAAGRTPLMIAVRQGSDFVETLLEKGADPNARDWQDKTPLVQAVMIDFQEVVTVLLDRGADPTLVDSRNRGPLYWACRQGSIEVFESILNALKPRKECAAQCERALNAAVLANRPDFVSKLLQVEHTRPNESGKDNWTPLFTAHKYEISQIATKLISAGAFDIDDVDVVGRRQLPSKWHPLDLSPSLRLESDQMTVRTGGPPNPDNMPEPCGVVLADFPMPGEGIYYFEVTINKAPKHQIMGVGFCEEIVPLTEMLGWNQWSWGYHGDDGHAFYGDSANPLDSYGNEIMSPDGEPGRPWGPTYSTGDVIGCGVNFDEETVFYTKNGTILGRAFKGIYGKLYPAVSLDTTDKDVSVTVKFWDGKVSSKGLFRYKGPWDAPATLEPPIRKRHGHADDQEDEEDED